MLSYLLIGKLICLFLLIKNHEKYTNQLATKETTYSKFLGGCALTVFLWPLALYFRAEKMWRNR